MPRVFLAIMVELNCVRLDLEPQTNIAAMVQPLGDALLFSREGASGEEQIAIREQKRYVARLAHLTLQPQEVSSPSGALFDKEKSYLITGGLGALGLLVAGWMSEEGARQLILVGRSPASPVAKAQIKVLEQAGTTVQIVQADVSAKEQMAELLATIEPTRPLGGIIHAAGTLSDSVLLQQNKESFAKLFAAKVKGAWNLHLLTEKMPLEFFVLFSTDTALLGNGGQANHAAANSFMDALAYYRQAKGLPALSIGWGAWSAIGAAARLQVGERIKSKGMGTISPQKGLEILKNAMLADKPYVGVSPIDWASFLANAPRGPFWANFKSQVEAQLPSTKPSHGLQQKELTFHEQLAQAIDQEAFLLDYVREQVAQVLGWEFSDEIEPHQGFFDLGMDSLTSLELRNHLQNALDCQLPATLTFRYPTIEALVGYLAEELLREEIPVETENEQTNSPETKDQSDPVLLALMDDLSASEVGELLDEKLANLDAWLD